MLCSERERLAAEYNDSVREFSEKLDSLNRAGEFSFAKAYRQSEIAREKCESLRKALHQHLSDHGCGGRATAKTCGT